MFHVRPPSGGRLLTKDHNRAGPPWLGAGRVLVTLSKKLICPPLPPWALPLSSTILGLTGQAKYQRLQDSVSGNMVSGEQQARYPLCLSLLGCDLAI